MAKIRAGELILTFIMFVSVCLNIGLGVIAITQGGLAKNPWIFAAGQIISITFGFFLGILVANFMITTIDWLYPPPPPPPPKKYPYPECPTGC